jgi:hypothetical protein
MFDIQPVSICQRDGNPVPHGIIYEYMDAV